MGDEDILKRFDDLSIWKQGDQRAPHKPLLVLYALGRWQIGQTDITFRQAEPDLTALLREFGPPRKSNHPEQPFWRLQRDGVWTVHAPAGLAAITVILEHHPKSPPPKLNHWTRGAGPRPQGTPHQAQSEPDRCGGSVGIDADRCQPA